MIIHTLKILQQMLKIFKVCLTILGHYVLQGYRSLKGFNSANQWTGFSFYMIQPSFMNELKTEIYQIAILLRSLKRKALHKNFFIKDVFSECDQIHKKMRIGHIY